MDRIGETAVASQAAVVSRSQSADSLSSLPALRLPIVVLLGVLLRFGVLWLGAQDALSERVEWSVGRTRLKQLRECSYWSTEAGWDPTAAASSTSLSPSGVTAVCSPLLLLLSVAISSASSLLPASSWLYWLAVRSLYVGCDVLIAAQLRSFVSCLVGQCRSLGWSSPGTASSVADSSARLADLVAACYLLNPVSILSCASLSLVVFTNVLLTTTLASGAAGRPVTASVCWSLLAAVDCCYAVMLLPLCCLVAHYSRRQLLVLLFVASLCSVGLLIALCPLYGGWHGVLAAFLYPLSSVELTPNIGLQWYFFTQTFDRFRTFFHLVLAALPITLSAALCLTPSLGGSQPHIAAVLVSCVVQLLHPQPVLGGLAVCGCVLLSVGWLCGGRLRPLYVQVCVALFSLLMLQLMWFMWLSPGSGNANFFYFQTLLFGFAFAALIVELTSAARRQRGDSLDEPSMK